MDSNKSYCDETKAISNASNNWEKNSEFVEETLGKLRRSKIYDRDSNFIVSKIYMNRQYFESLNKTINVHKNSYHQKS